LKHIFLKFRKINKKVDMKLIFYIFFIGISMILSSCHLTLMDCNDGSGEIIKEERNVGKFDKIKTNGAFDIYLYQADSNLVIVEIDDNLAKYVRTSVVDNELEIDEVKSLCTKIKKIYITSPNYKKLEINGASDVLARNPLIINYLEVETNGASLTQFEELYCPNLRVSISGAGDFRIKKGKGGNFHIQATGAGDIKALDFPSDSIKVEISGAGDVDINARTFLLVKIFGSGDVSYRASDSTKVVKKILGAGSINKVK